MAEGLFLSTSEITTLVNFLKEEYLVFAPVREDSETMVFRRLESYEDPALDLDYSLSILPPQKCPALYPSHQKLFEFVLPVTEMSGPATDEDEVVLFGLHLTDLLALQRLDRIMEKPYLDTNYSLKRERLLIIGLDYPSHPRAFQPPADLVDEGLYDLFLDNVGEVYQLLVGSEKGRAVIKNFPFQVTCREVDEEKPYHDPILADVEKLTEVVENSRESSLWDEMAKRCLGCGICTWVCPLCYCFDVCDQVSLNGQGQRQRRWDSCLLKKFAGVAGGNFRPSLRDRFYNWYHHKFVRMPREYGFVGCTGCGRCSHFCPVNINIKKNLVRLMKEYQEKKGD